jgi:hypothetical protein
VVANGHATRAGRRRRTNRCWLDAEDEEVRATKGHCSKARLKTAEPLMTLIRAGATRKTPLAYRLQVGKPARCGWVGQNLRNANFKPLSQNVTRTFTQVTNGSSNVGQRSTIVDHGPTKGLLDASLAVPGSHRSRLAEPERSGGRPAEGLVSIRRPTTPGLSMMLYTTYAAHIHKPGVDYNNKDRPRVDHNQSSSDPTRSLVEAVGGNQ